MASKPTKKTRQPPPHPPPRPGERAEFALQGGEGRSRVAECYTVRPFGI
jgi:hypothetical protein